MEADLVTAIGSLGVGAVLAIVIFLMYRIDRRASEKRLTKLLEQDQKSRDNNTRALNGLTILLKKINGKK